MKAKVIDLQVFKKQKAVAAINQEKQARIEGKKTEKAQEIIEALSQGETVKAAVAANEFAALDQPKRTPAYCDPENETKGSKYEANKSKSLTALAKLMRQDIKDAKMRGQLPKSVKVSVRTSRYSGGGSIDVSITALPEGQNLYSHDYIKATNNLTEPPPYGEPISQYSEAVTGWIEVLKQIHGAYNRDNSDSMTDYFDVNYYGSVGIDCDLRFARKEIEVKA